MIAPAQSMFLRRAVALLIASLGVGVLSTRTSAQQLSYSSGQNVSPAYEGWQQNSDGSFRLWFGYMNRNWIEEVVVPIGEHNRLEPAGPDSGQPTRFLPRRNRFVFAIDVPSDFGKQEIVWELTVRGVTERAHATLRPDYFLETIDLMSERGALGPGFSTPEIRRNRPPVLQLEGGLKRTIRVGDPLVLVASATDDGVPPVPPMATEEADVFSARPPKQATVNSAVGLRMSWFVYRGQGSVEFQPEQIAVWEDSRVGANSPWAQGWRPPSVPADGKWTSSVVFREPGEYTLRCRADDGGLWTDETVVVTVVP